MCHLYTTQADHKTQNVYLLLVSTTVAQEEREPEESSDNDSSSLSGGAIAGSVVAAIVGCTLVVAVAIAVVVYLAKRETPQPISRWDNTILVFVHSESEYRTYHPERKCVCIIHM